MYKNSYEKLKIKHNTEYLKGYIASAGTAALFQQGCGWAVVIRAGAIIAAVIHTQWLRCCTYCSASRDWASATVNIKYQANDIRVCPVNQQQQHNTRTLSFTQHVYTKIRDVICFSPKFASTVFFKAFLHVRKSSMILIIAPLVMIISKQNEVSNSILLRLPMLIMLTLVCWWGPARLRRTKCHEIFICIVNSNVDCGRLELLTQ